MVFFDFLFIITMTHVFWFHAKPDIDWQFKITKDIAMDCFSETLNPSIGQCCL